MPTAHTAKSGQAIIRKLVALYTQMIRDFTLTDLCQLNVLTKFKGNINLIKKAMSKNEEIEYKLVQALMIWRTQGGAKSIKISEATKIAQKNNPGITENEIRAIVKSSDTLDLQYDEIILSKKLTDLM